MVRTSLQKNVLSVLRGEDWKRVRGVVTPAFTTGKIKRVRGVFSRNRGSCILQVIPGLQKCAENLCELVERYIDDGREIELKE